MPRISDYPNISEIKETDKMLLDTEEGTKSVFVETLKGLIGGGG